MLKNEDNLWSLVRFNALLASIVANGLAVWVTLKSTEIPDLAWGYWSIWVGGKLIEKRLAKNT